MPFEACLRNSFMLTVIEYETIDSTNDEALRYVESGGTESRVFVAKQQTQGRGRGDHRWESDTDAGLYYTALLQQRRFPARPTIVDDLVLAKTIQGVIEQLSGVKTIFKKPNDIYVRGKKLGGLLLETFASSHTRYLGYVIIGIGLNLNQTTFSPSVKDKATSLYLETGKTFDRYQFIGLITTSLELLYPRVDTELSQGELLQELVR